MNKKTKRLSNGGAACIWASPEMITIIDKLVKPQRQLQRINKKLNKLIDIKERKQL